MSVKKAGIILLSTLSLAAVIGGCSSSSKEGAPGDVAKVGDTGCFQCHAATADPLTGETFIEQYQRSLHAELGCESCHGGGAQHNGVGPFPYTLNSEVSDAQKAERCAMCHDGVSKFTTNSGEVVVAPLSSSPNFQNGNHANPFSEEEAHEAKCARCHSHEGSILYGKEGFTGDKTIIDNPAYQPVLARDPETFNTIKCATCHEHGGNIRQTKTRDLAGNIVTWDPNRNKVVDQLDICTSCHNMTTNEGRLIGSGNILSIANTGGGFTNVTTAPYYHDTSWYRTLPSTHYDQPASGTITNVGTTIEGYVMRRVGQTIAPETVLKNPCFDCHGHEFKTNTRALAGRPERGTTIFTDWAQSGHAGGLLTQKLAAAAANPITGNRGTPEYTASGKAQVDAVMKAGATDASGIGWTHYDWDDTAGRGTCQRCHTSTGAANFLNNPNTYVMNGSGNSFTHLAGWTNTNKRSGQQELLYCWGCHTNAGTGKLRNPGAILHRYSAANYNYTIQFPDASGSNVCIACHTGRETGESIKTNRDADGVLSFVNSHYLTAGGQLYGLTGYEYAGVNYANPTFFAHDKIGSTAAAGTGTNGPCAGCHMKTANSHKFSVVSTNTTGVITKIRSQAICNTCHTGQFALTETGLEAEKEDYEAALEATVAVLASKGIHFFNAHPYFYNGPNGTGGAFTTWTSAYGSPQWRNVMGAAFNANLLIHDPGGYAHNRFYSKRLMWDSIDFIFDSVLNNDVTAAIDAQVTAGRLTAEVAAAAKAYLGTTRP